MEEFTKNRMTSYAYLLRDIADVYLPQSTEKEEGYTSRADLLADRKIQKQREVFSKIVMNASGQLMQMTRDRSPDTRLSVKQEKKIKTELLAAGISVKEYYRRKINRVKFDLNLEIKISNFTL